MPEHPAPPPQETATHITRGDAVVVFAYACFAGLWILLSDQVMAWLFTEPAALALVSTYKGMAFVVVTTVLLYILLRRRSGSAGAAREARHVGWSIVLLVVAMVALVAAGVLREYASQRALKVAQLQTIADLKAQQVTDWLAERHREAEFIATSSHYPELYRDWSQAGNAAAGQVLQSRLRKFLQARGFNEVSLLDQDGRTLWSTHAAPMAPSPDLLAAVRKAADTRHVVRADPHIQPDARPHLDFVVPLGAAGAPVQATVVLHAHLDGWLYPTLKAWPVPSTSGETMIFRKDGDQIVSINDLRHRPGAALAMRLPISTPDLPTARVLRGEVRPGAAVEGNDYRGVAVLGVVRAIPETDWFLVAKIDQSELLADALHSTIWIAMAGLLALLMLAGVLVIARQRQRLAVTEGIRESQAEHLRALRLLSAIADSSDDAIFAKDPEGRYVLFNHAANRFVGMPMEAVLGRDDRALFPADQAEYLMDRDRRVAVENRAITDEEVLSTPAGERVFLATKAPLYDEDGQVIGTFGISRDITERKQAETSLRRMADDLSATLQAIPDLLFEVDEQGRYIKVRASREDLLAAPQGQLLGSTVHDALPPAAARTVMEALAAATRDGADYGRVIELPLPIGPRWFELSVARKDSAPGELQHFIVLSRDVTERQRADARLAEREARYRAVIESTSDGFWVVDVNECSIQTANAAYARLSGYSLEELQGLPVADVEVQESHDEVRAHIERIMREGSAVFESRHRARDGHIWPVEVAVSYWPEGGYMFAFVRDISARKTAEAALRESEASYRQLFESSQDAMCILAPPDSRLRDVNRAAVRMFRAESAEQLLTLAPWDVSPERQPDGRPSDEAAVERVRQAMEKGAAFFEWQHQRLDGESFPADVLITRVEQHGETLLQATVRDITERKAAEAELKARNDELERFNHATVGRELDVLEMKKTINALALELGRHPPYPLAFLNDEDGGN